MRYSFETDGDIRTQSSIASVGLNLERLRFRCVRRVGAHEAVSMFSSLVRVVLFIVVVAGSTGVARARDVVPFSASVAPGTIVIKTAERRLYFVINDGSAVRYPVAVGRPAKQWVGQVAVAGKHLRPAWSPPEEVRLDNPDFRAARQTIRWGLRP